MIVESGNLSNMSDRVGLIASILAELGYDAVGTGETDLRTSAEEFFKKTAENKLTVLDASPQPHESTVPYLVRNVGGARVGIISFGFAPPAADDNEYARRKALYTAYKAAREGSDVLVVLDQANLIDQDWIERNEKRLGTPDVVVGGVTRQYPQEGRTIGKTFIAPTSIQGKHVGVVDVELTTGQDPKFTLQRIALETDVAEDEAVKKRVDEFMGRLRQATAQAANQNPSTPSNTGTAAYYPSVMCSGCHTKEYNDWGKTKHAQAVATLTSQQRAIPECLKCHSEMFRKLQRVTVTQQGPAGVECATCHAKSLPHSAERKNVTTRVKVDPKICVECHDKQWSPNYEEKSYMAKVSHVGAENVAAATPASPTVPASPVVQTSSPPAAREKPPAPPPLPPSPPVAQ